MTDDAIMRCIQGTPILNLMIDAQSGTAGVETRVEASPTSCASSRREAMSMSKPQALIEQVRSSVAVELERRHAPTLLADRKAAKAAKHKAKHHKYTKAAFFRYCYYDPAFKFFCEQVLDVDYLPLPEAPAPPARWASRTRAITCARPSSTSWAISRGARFGRRHPHPVRRPGAGWATTASYRSPSCGTWATSSS